MSILIPGMEMPKNCGQCPFKKLSPTGESMICELTLFTVPWDWKTTDCPLIPVPPHGRLIDADALIVALETQDYSGAPDTLEDWTPMDMTKAEIADIKAAPTIIPAEEEKPIITKASPASLGIYTKEGE